MNRHQFIKHLENHGCKLHRHGGKHDIYINTTNKSGISTVPRHNQINPNTAKNICKDLLIPTFP
ncbi:type II toxin-antitoxin system HicA family toxin [Legionella sp. 27fs60]|uniref:Type II toxin-antitoxin system HicA family toxin n=1 Tax=Legionella bononiensis TaxID=2793102 RepID=A0ABS1W8L4_9GAMM|nr:type II toxin-antitoxin system HicA family toxin [Legionella bononiensis]MBL7525709.1 type II toxin-antitoxin system HicA family toxin [Legionella bononiensis]MBL7561892.1 type II toxin-antitoxin system HicA family toxin [Legionella bononiensis]